MLSCYLRDNLFITDITLDCLLSYVIDDYCDEQRNKCDTDNPCHPCLACHQCCPGSREGDIDAESTREGTYNCTQIEHPIRREMDAGKCISVFAMNKDNIHK